MIIVGKGPSYMEHTQYREHKLCLNSAVMRVHGDRSLVQADVGPIFDTDVEVYGPQPVLDSYGRGVLAPDGGCSAVMAIRLALILAPLEPVVMVGFDALFGTIAYHNDFKQTAPRATWEWGLIQQPIHFRKLGALAERCIVNGKKLSEII